MVGRLERDPGSGTVYASVRTTDAHQPNVLLAFAGETGVVERVLQPGADPGPLALCNDGCELYDATTFAQTGTAMLAWPTGYTGNTLQQLELLGQQGVAFRDDNSVLLYPTALKGVAGCGH